MALPVSVIIPSFNRSHTLMRAIDSVLQQTSMPEEIWVIDDGSTDDTPHMLAANYPRVNVIRQENAGVSAARNTGIKQSQSPWVAFLDSDDEWMPNKLEMQFSKIEKDFDIGILHSDEIWIRNGRRVNPMNKHKKQGGDIFEQSLGLCAMSPSTVVLRRELLDEEGLFDESLPACEDYDLWLRLCYKYSVTYVDQMLIRKYGGHADQLSRQHWGMDRFRTFAIAKLLRRKVLTTEQDQAARKMLQKKCRVLLSGANKRKQSGYSPIIATVYWPNSRFVNQCG